MVLLPSLNRLDRRPMSYRVQAVVRQTVSMRWIGLSQKPYTGHAWFHQCLHFLKVAGIPHRLLSREPLGNHHKWIFYFRTNPQQMGQWESRQIWVLTSVQTYPSGLGYRIGWNSLYRVELPPRLSTAKTHNRYPTPPLSI